VSISFSIIIILLLLIFISDVMSYAASAQGCRTVMTNVRVKNVQPGVFVGTGFLWGFSV